MVVQQTTRPYAEMLFGNDPRHYRLHTGDWWLDQFEFWRGRPAEDDRWVLEAWRMLEVMLAPGSGRPPKEALYLARWLTKQASPEFRQQYGAKLDNYRQMLKKGW